MKRRCESEKHHAFKDYGGRGIYVDLAWQDFNVFCQWMLSAGSEKGLDLDRVDVNGPYGPGNCRLTSRKINSNNKRNNRRVTAWGEEKTVSEWSSDKRCLVNQRTLLERLNRGWEAERAISSQKDMVRKSQNPTHCKRGGHEYTPDNTYYSKAAPHLKKCRRCHSERQKKAYEAKGLYK